MPSRTLVIEDNPTNLQLMTYLLQAFGHLVSQAADGKAECMPPGARSRI